MKRYKYSWTRAYDVDPQIAGEIFQSHRDDASVLAAARDRKHPLHSAIEWDTTNAAESYRLHQIRQMRCSLLCEIVTLNQPAQHVRAFIRTVDKAGYIPTLEANPDDLSTAEKRCWLQMKTFRARWRGLQFARAVIEAIESKTPEVARTRIKRRR